MKLLEVNSNIARIEYNPAENHLLPSDFLLIEDSNQKLIAQILNISTTEKTNNIVDVRLILSIDKNDNLSYYNGYIPLKSSVVMYIHPDEIIELIKSTDENIYLGNLSNHNECFVQVPLSCIDDRVYIQSDRYDNVKTIIQNISAELISKKRKIIIFDFNGHYSSANNTPRLKITDSFKLPLNTEAFNNILECDITDCPIEDKTVIQSIVLELREYIKTLDNKFLPFTLFKTVIDNELASNPISGLKLLRNKLWLYAQEGIFAESKTQFEILNNILDNQNVVIIDASTLEDKWYKFAIQTIQNLVNKNCYMVISLNDLDTDKKTITSLYNNPSVIPIVSTSYDSKYRQILKSICKNQILFKPSKQINDEETYSYYINRMNSTEFIVYGETELYIPLIIELQPFNSSTPDEVTQNEIKKEVDKLFTLGRRQISKNNLNLTNSEKKEEVAIENTSEKSNLTENISEQTEDEVISSKEQDNIVRPMSMQDEIIRPMSVTEDNPVYVEEKEPQPSVDDDFNDEDLDFLDERNEEHLTIEDIRKTAKEKLEEPKYDIFSPMDSDEDMTIIDKTYSTDDIIEPIINDEEIKDVEIISENNNITQNENVANVESDLEIEQNLNDKENNVLDDLFEEIEEVQDINENDDEVDVIDELIQTEDNNTQTIEDLDEDIKETATDEIAINTETEPEPETALENELETEPKLKSDPEPSKEKEETEVNNINDTLDEIPEDTSYKEETNKEVEEKEKHTEKEESEEQKEPEENIVNKVEEDKTDDTVEEIEENQEKEDNDLSSIDEIINNIEEKAENGDINNIQEEEPAEEKDEEQSKAPPINENINQRIVKPLPYYNTDEDYDTMPKELPFKIGDKISHPKLGVGVIIDFMHFGDRIHFCRIDFENKGIRLLDPRVSQFEKI